MKSIRTILCSQTRLLSAAFAGAFGLTTSVLPAITRTWDGGGAGSSWATPANWAPDGMPSANDTLVFPSPAVEPATGNNMPVNFQIASLKFDAPAYNVSGNNLFVSGGPIEAGFAVAGTATVGVNLSFNTDVTVRAATSRTSLDMNGSINPGGFELIMDGSGLLDFAGGINGVGSFRKEGAGVARISGASSIGFVSEVNAGTLLCNASLNALVTHNAGTVGGTGSMKGLSSLGGSVAPGDGGPGVLSVQQDCALSAATTLKLEIAGGSPGAGGYDQLSVPGTVNLAGATLNVTLLSSYAPLLGQALRIIDNGGSDPVQGTFSGLPQNAVISLGNADFRVSYTGGTGNDVTLTVITVGVTGITRIWTGGVDNFWSTPGNWSGGVAPKPGDSLEFPAVAANKTNSTALPAGFFIAEVRYTGGGYTSSGAPIHIGAAGIAQVAPAGAPPNTVTFGISNLTGTIFVRLNSGGNFIFQPQGGITQIAGSALAFINDAAGALLDMQAGVAGAGAITKSGAGVVKLSAATAHTGGVRIYDGVLLVPAPASLGNSFATVGVDAAGILEVGQPGVPFTAPQVLDIAGTLRSADHAAPITWSGTIKMENGFTGTIHARLGTSIDLKGKLTGDGGMNFSGGGLIAVTGFQPNDYTGSTLVTAFECRLGKAGGTAIPGPVRVQDGARLTTAPGMTHQIALSAPVEVAGAGFEFNTEVIGALKMEGGTLDGIQLTIIGSVESLASADASVIEASIFTSGGSTQWTVGDGAAMHDLVVSGNLRGGVNQTAGVVKLGAGTLAFPEVSAPPPQYDLHMMLIDEGTVVFDDHPDGAGVFGPNLVLNGGRLTGTGQVRTVTAAVSGGHVDPGHSPGLLTTGTLGWDGGIVFKAEVNGPAVGVEYDQLAVTGTVSLGGAVLNFIGAESLPIAGTEYILISNDDTEAIAGTFSGLPDGAIITSGGLTWRLSYSGGDGNNVTVTIPTTQRVWTGGGPDNRWTTPLNWAGGVAPIPGDDLVFPAGASQSDCSNTFPPGTPFGRISVTGAGYRFSGNLMTLRHGFLHDAGAGTTRCELRLLLGFDQSWDMVSGELRLADGAEPFLHLGGRTLTFDGASRAVIGHVINGIGALTKPGTGDVVLTAANTYIGPTEVRAGRLAVQNVQALGSPAQATRVLPGGTLVLEAPASAYANEPVELGGTLRTGHASQTWSAPMTLIAPEATIDAGSGHTMTITTAISGAHPLRKSGPGTLILDGNNSYTGLTEILEGTLAVNGQQPVSPVHVRNGATLTGNGRTGPLTANGIVQPGYPGIGTLVVEGTATFSADASLHMQLSSPVPGTGHDQLRVLSDTTLAGALVLSGGYTLTYADSIVLIDQAGAAPSNGSFTGLPEGGTTGINGALVRISYAGGDGNDVVLRRDQPPAPEIVSVQFENTPSESKIVINGEGIAGVAYALEASIDLVTWTSVTQVIAGSDGSFALGESVAGSFDRRYFRVVGL